MDVLLKTTLDVLYGIVTYDNMIKNSELLKSKPYLPIFLMFPNIASRLHMNITVWF